MAKRQYLFPGQSYTNPATEVNGTLNGPAMTTSAETHWQYPRLARQLVANDALPHQQVRGLILNQMFALLPYGHG